MKNFWVTLAVAVIEVLIVEVLKEED